MNIGQHPLTGGMVHQLNKLDLISNNLANINTNGFKQKNVTTETFSKFLSEYPLKKDLNFNKNTILASNFAVQTMNMIPKSSSHYTNNKAGSIKLTGNDFDFALTEKDHFFVIHNLDTNKYVVTRDGAFVPKDNGLFTKEGYPVLNNNLLPIDINTDGWEQRIGIFKSEFKNLDSEGDNLLNPNNMKITQPNQLEVFKEGLILQQNLESSNINSVIEMAKMIETNRLFEQLQKVSKNLQEVDSLSNNKIGNSKS